MTGIPWHLPGADPLGDIIDVIECWRNPPPTTRPIPPPNDRNPEPMNKTQMRRKVDMARVCEAYVAQLGSEEPAVDARGLFAAAGVSKDRFYRLFTGVDDVARTAALHIIAGAHRGRVELGLGEARAVLAGVAAGLTLADAIIALEAEAGARGSTGSMIFVLQDAARVAFSDAGLIASGDA